MDADSKAVQALPLLPARRPAQNVMPRVRCVISQRSKRHSQIPARKTTMEEQIKNPSRRQLSQ